MIKIMLLLFVVMNNKTTPGYFQEVKMAPDEILVKFTSELRGVLPEEYLFSGITGIEELDALNKKYGLLSMERLWRPLDKVGELEKKFGVDLVYLFKFKDKVDLEKVIKDYSSLPFVEYAEPNLYHSMQKIPDDPSFSSQWHHTKMQNPETWDITTGSEDIVFAIIDSDCQWNHPDIEPNIWINEEEDINGDGKFTVDDINGRDDDGNGFVDDVVGWNFYNNSNDPSPDPAHSGVEGYGHGTHCFGDAIEATNNGIGGAGVGYNCRGIGFSCVTDDGKYINAARAVSAMYYAANKGARVMSLSFGNYAPNSSEQSAINYCYSKGMLIFGAAGNVSTSTKHYPAAFPNVIAVAASDASDKRADWPDWGGTDYGSAFGDWIDVVAPGDNILSTIPTDKYASWDGTSMASPVAAGVAGLLWSVHPDWTNEMVRDRIFEGCDPMPDDTMYQKGLLGHGRVNSFKTVAPTVLSNISVKNVTASNIEGNPGNEASIVVYLQNEEGWQDAEDVSVVLTSHNKYVSVTTGTSNIGDIKAGSESNNSGSPFRVKILNGYLPQKVKFTLTINSTPSSYKTDTTLYIPLGEPDLLLVDDDGGEDIEQWYEEAMDSLDHVLYDIWDTESKGTPSGMENYQAVIWFTGNNGELSEEEQNAIASFLDNGGNLIISGQNIGEDIGSSDFYSNYLHASFLNGDMSELIVYGESSDPIAMGDTLLLGGGGGANNCDSPDGVEPVNDGSGIFKYKNSGTWGSVKYAGDYKVAYYAFPLESIGGPSSKYTQKWEIIERTLNWMGVSLPKGIEEEKPIVTRDKDVILSQSIVDDELVVYLPHIKDNTGVNIDIYNITGSMVYKTKERVSKNILTLKGLNLPSGIYFLHVNINSKEYIVPFYRIK